jgi:multidrug transporter EmrE-like cation transporter
VFLGERLTMSQLVGVGCIIGGILFLDLARTRSSAA